MPPEWLTVVSRISIGLALTCSVVVLHDMFVRGYRQQMWIMESVWPVSALYFGPLALPAYYWWGRPMSDRWHEEYGDPPKKSFSAITATGVSHCGAGCTLGDIIGATLVFFLGWEIAGLALWPEYFVDFALAFALGIAFQYFSIVPMRGLSFRKGIKEAMKADSLSLVSFEVGLFGWMAFMQFVLYPHFHPDHAAYWFLMQIGMILGFVTSYPVNWWLIRRGTKEAM